ncbi:hypothetical protein AA0488_2645 [Kozakia baliensis NRIC 0488]|nr:hypothetical protein AA0488_2645 [Kozakia baliensis NRIC 0488]
MFFSKDFPSLIRIWFDSIDIKLETMIKIGVICHKPILKFLYSGLH